MVAVERMIMRKAKLSALSFQECEMLSDCISSGLPHFLTAMDNFDGVLAQCSKCRKWFHQTCVDVPDAVFVEPTYIIT